MYLEIRTDDPAVIHEAMARQIEDGRTANVSLGREGWLFTMSLTVGESEGDTAAEGRPLTARAVA